MSANSPLGQPSDGAYDRAFGRLATAIRKPGTRFWLLAGLAYLPLGIAALCVLFYGSDVDSSLRQDLVLGQAVRDGLGNSLLFVVPYVCLATLLISIGNRPGWWRVLLGVLVGAYSLWNLLWIGFSFGIPFIPTTLAALAAFVAVPRRPPAAASEARPERT